MDHHRTKEVDFLEYFLISPVVFVVDKDTTYQPFLDFSRAFDPVMWAVSLVTFIACCLFVTVILKITKNDFNSVSRGIRNSIFEVFSVIVRQGKIVVAFIT